jgi:hypothetical protein
MKKQTRKITLSRETVRRLTELRLSDAAGGFTTIPKCGPETNFISCPGTCTTTQRC